MLWTQALLVDSQRAAIERLGLRELSAKQKHLGKVVERGDKRDGQGPISFR